MCWGALRVVIKKNLLNIIGRHQLSISSIGLKHRLALQWHLNGSYLWYYLWYDSWYYLRYWYNLCLMVLLMVLLQFDFLEEMLLSGFLLF